MQENNNDIKKTLQEIEEEAKKIAGWDNLQVLGINKYGTEAVVHTTRGSMKLPMKDLFMVQSFRSKVFETFGIMIDKVSSKIYEAWLAEWSKTIKDMGMEYGTSLDVMKEALIEYLETAEDRDIIYLKKGNPILLKDGHVAFRSTEFLAWAKKKNYASNYNDDQIRSVLREVGCVPRQIGPTRMRVWTLKLPETQEVETQPTIQFEAVGRAPDIMNDDTSSLTNEDEFEF